MNLPDIDFVKIDSKEIEKEIITTYERITQRTLSPGNPERLFLESVAYVIAMQRFYINYAAKMNLLAYAKGEFLDHLGALLGVYRLKASPARTTLRFSVSQPLDFDVVIPKGTRATPDGKLYFATLNEAKIEAGSTSADVEAVCEIAGVVGNGFVAGQINRLVDIPPYIERVENTTASSGGSDIEDDEHFRMRIQLAPEKFSNAGSKGAYEYWAKTAHQDIADVSVVSKNPGDVSVYVLLKNGDLPSEDILKLVKNVLSDDKVRPLTDNVSVLSPEVVNYEIDLTYYIYPDYAALASQIDSFVKDAVDKYTAWQETKIGRDIIPSKLISLIQNIDGIKRVELRSPAYEQIDDNQVAKASSITIQNGGVESV